METWKSTRTEIKLKQKNINWKKTETEI